MNVSCPQCKTVFRVDPRKVPPDGVRARCSVCGGVFEVVSDRARATAPAGAAVSESKAFASQPAPPAAPARAEPERAPTSDTGSPPRVDTTPPQREQASRPVEPAVGAGPAAPPRAPQDAEPAPRPSTPRPPTPAPPPERSAAPEPAPGAGAPRAGRPAFGGQLDPDARARRLARALVSDVAAYHPERQERGLREGRLKELFQEELKKSWQEYVEQVGIDLAKSTPFFRDALNEILAKGKRVF